jgi:hypothetical protein
MLTGSSTCTHLIVSRFLSQMNRSLTCESSKSTRTFPLVSLLLMLCGRSELSSNGSPVFGSDWMSIAPI